VNTDVVIIGGGLAGLSTAVDLASRGMSTLVLEQRQHLGGRAHSFVHEPTGDVVDNGQHLMMGCYRETEWFLRTIGAYHLTSLQPQLRIPFLRPNRGAALLKCPALPAPFHLLTGLISLNSLSLVDRLRLLRVGKELQRPQGDVEAEIAGLTVHEWLSSLRQSEENKKYLWDIIAIGSLNDDPKDVSALLFYRVLRTAFLGKRLNASLLLPRVGLTELFVNPAIQYLSANRGSVKTGSGVEGLVTEAKRVTAVKLTDGSTIEGNAFVSSVPWYAAKALLLGTPAGSVLPPDDSFRASAIISVNLWFDRQVMADEFAALLDSRIHWVFNKSALLKTSGASLQYLTLVISGAASMADLSTDELVKIAVDDLSRVLPEVRNATLKHSLVVKEKRATFSPLPGVERLRPSTATPLENFFLAGDWINTGFPATIEGALMSGRRAAEMAARL
jgi:squalene-associated FAD-dependent desaturase